MKIKTIVISCCLLCSLNVAGQESDTLAVEHAEQGAHSLTDRLKQLQEYLDRTTQNSVDPRFIEVPEKAWRVILRYNQNAVDVDYTQGVDVPESNEYGEWKWAFEPPRASSVGIWVGYQGTGVSIYKSLAKNAGRYYALSSTGAKYGVNFRLRRFGITPVTFSATGYVDGEEDFHYEQKGNMPSPVWIRSVYLNGYYVFNGRRYSQAAAYNQSVIQRHSAGSFILGATWYQSSFDFSDMDNAVFMIIGNGLNRIKVHQANIGLGYGYNFVPFRGLVINVMAMPTLSVYNRVKVYKYDFNYKLMESDEEVDNYGQWNPQTRTWANGEKYKPLQFYTVDNNQLDAWELEPETEYSAWHLNIDLRLGIVYNWKNYFLGVYAQLNNFSYKKDNSRVKLNDGYAQMAIGVRL